MASGEELGKLAQKRVAEAIRRAMAEGGLTQAEVARKAGIPQPRVSTLLSGARGKFSGELLRLLDAVELKLEVVDKRYEEGGVGVASSEGD